MAGEKSIKLPIIDFSELEEGTPRWESVKKQVRKALEDYGCFQALYLEIPQTLPKSVINGMQPLFDFPLEVKMQIVSDASFLGYFGQIPFFPLYESMSIHDVLNLENIESFINHFLSEGDPKLCKIIHSYAEQLSEMDRNVRRMVLESFELEKYMDEHMNSTDYQLRVIKYDAPHSQENKPGLTTHTDVNLLSILSPNEVAGLEILTKDGQWIQVEPSPDYYMVIVGDCFHAWTNGRLHCVEHRVMVKGDGRRYSMGLFSTPNAGYMIEVPEEMVDDSHPLLFKPYDNTKFLNLLKSKFGQKSLALLKEYYGA